MIIDKIIDYVHNYKRRNMLVILLCLGFKLLKSYFRKDRYNYLWRNTTLRVY